jgi:hypothetical protein
MNRPDPCALTEKEMRILERLDAAVSSPGAREALARIAARVEETLRRGAEAIEAWEVVPLDVYGEGLPSDVGSSWIFVLRHGVTTGAERHPNSRQRMVTWSGGGDIQVHDGERWRSHLLAVPSGRPLEDRWISIPPDTWHQGVVSGEDWVVVSFHTVPAEELVEERPDPADSDPFRPQRTRRRRYVEVKQA